MTVGSRGVAQVDKITAMIVVNSAKPHPSVDCWKAVFRKSVIKKLKMKRL